MYSNKNIVTVIVHVKIHINHAIYMYHKTANVVSRGKSDFGPLNTLKRISLEWHKKLRDVDVHNEKSRL